MSYIANRTEGDDRLIVTFHGTGGSEHQFHDLAAELFPGASIVSPRGDVSEAGHARFFRRTSEGVYDMDDLARRTDAMAGFVADERARVGATSVVGFGYSNGANILASVLFRDPGLFDQAALLHPLIPFDPPPQPGLAGKSVLITAGQRDPICPPEETQRLARYLNGQESDVRLFWHGGGHELRQEEIDLLAQFASPEVA